MILGPPFLPRRVSPRSRVADRPFARGRLIGLVGVASLGLLALTVPSADALPSAPEKPGSPAASARIPKATLPRTGTSTVSTPVASRPTLTAEARAAGIEPGNAPMGWRNDRFASTTADVRRSLSSANGVSAENSVSSESSVSTTSAKKLVAMTGVLGIDVSSYQKTVNWASYKAQNRMFAYVKATEGSSYRNPYFSSQYNGAAKAGLIRGAYHFANPGGKSGKTQADYFVKYGGAWKADGKTLPGVLDIEYNPYGSTCYGKSKTAMVKWISDFVTEYKKRTTRDAVIYTTADWWSRCTGNTTKFNATNPLWVARYGTSKPGTLPGKWPFYTFWQYSASPIDQDKFSASYARLQVLARNK